MSDKFKIEILATPTCPAGNALTSTIADPAKVFVSDYFLAGTTDSGSRPHG